MDAIPDSSIYDILRISQSELKTVLLYHEMPEGNTLKFDPEGSIMSTIDSTIAYDLVSKRSPIGSDSPALSAPPQYGRRFKDPSLDKRENAVISSIMAMVFNDISSIINRENASIISCLV